MGRRPRNTNNNVIQSDDEKVAVLETIIDEQKRDSDYLLHIYNRLRSSEGLLLTAAFGIVAYLYYSAPSGSKASIAQRLFVPAEDYGKVIYFMAAGAFLYGLLRLIVTVFGNNPWETAYETPKDNYVYKKLDNLRYLKKRYDKCCEFNSEVYFKRRNQLTFLFYDVLITAIVLIVIKTLK